jgi:general secretion pathway protein M
MRDWFESLASRERLIVSAGTGVVAVILFWSIVLAPLASGVDRMNTRIESKRASLSWMQTAAAEIRSAGDVSTAAGDPDQSLVVVIDRTARQSGIGESLTRNQPVGEDGIRVRLEGAPFDVVTQWLGQLQAGHGLALESATFERGSANGTVTVSLMLRQPG